MAFSLPPLLKAARALWGRLTHRLKPSPGLAFLPMTQPSAAAADPLDALVTDLSSPALSPSSPSSHPAAPDALLDFPLPLPAPLPLVPTPPAREPLPAEAKLPAKPAPRLKRHAARPASFSEYVFEFAGQAHAFWLFVPGAPAGEEPQGGAGMPVVLMLHGCKQNAADFARGTAMNELAEEHQCIVIYPEQRAKANSMRCWNWFETAHQGRDAGEPAMLAALTRYVLRDQSDTTARADASRVYVAGLSAGGAMAAVVAGLFPDVFAAVGVHSGLPSGAARDVMSALTAMRRGARRPTRLHPSPDSEFGSPVMPTLVFHGRADTTVHPENGDQVVEAALAAAAASGMGLTRQDVIEGDADAAPSAGRTTPERHSTRSIYSTAKGQRFIEYWSVTAGPHAWSGGNPAGSFTDPHGPSASKAMLAFFLQHRLEKNQRAIRPD